MLTRCLAVLILALVALALPIAAAPRRSPAPCKPVRFEDGTTAVVRGTSTDWSVCEPHIRITLKAGLPPAEDKGLPHKAGRFYSLRRVDAASQSCTLWIYADPRTRDEAAHVLRGWDLCIDSLHTATEASL